jgi:predicted transcriptional regulator
MDQKNEVEIRFIRLEDDVCDALNRMSKESRRRVSDVANEALREWLQQAQPEHPDAASSS